MRLILLLLITGCSFIDQPGNGRTDSVQVVVAVESMPYSDLAIECARWENARACTTETGIYVQGSPKRTVIRFKVQYLDYRALGDKCGRFTGNGSCYEDGTLYTSSNYTGDKVAGMGDLIDEAFDLGLAFNYRESLGHELHTHILGNGTDPRYGRGSRTILGN
jgi:hypothetical protein